MESFKVQVLTPVNIREGHMVRAILTDETYRALLDLAKQTRHPLSQLTSKAIDYALANVELVEM